jgi:DNA-binding transcriptional ArsR family regulator
MVESIALDLVFHALSDSTRRAILQAVSRGERTVGELAGPFRMSLAAVSKHLKVLERARLVRRRKQGSFYLISLDAEALMGAEQWMSHYRQFWGERLAVLKDSLEKERP